MRSGKEISVSDVQVLEYLEYRKSLIALRRRGGPYQKAAEKAIVIQDDLREAGTRAKLQVTDHGESRIKKAVKYELGANACRLVTVQDSGYIFLCFVGTHDEVDKWLDKNRGLTIRIDGESRALAIRESLDIAEPSRRLNGDVGYTSRPLLSLMSERLQDEVMRGLSWSLSRSVAEAEVHISDDEIEALASRVENEDQRAALFDVLIELRAENVEGAVRRVLSYIGELQAVEEVAEQEPIPQLIDSSDFQNIRIDSEHYRKLIEHYAANADFKDWMLFMHPDQQQYVDADYAGPAKLSGVSGSGKTCVVVRRALALADKYPGEKILILTLNRSLSSLIQTLVDKAAEPGVRERIEVLPFFKLCQDFLIKFEPENSRLYDDVTWKSMEHIDEIWREYYRCELNNYDARVLQRLHDSLISRGIDAESYVREEFDWIRSATLPGGRDAYLKMERAGRGYPLDESYRKELLEGLRGWEGKMRLVGVTDYLGIASALLLHLDRLVPAYRSVLIDESQDFGTIDLRIIRRLVGEASNDIFLCGDAAQRVSSKRQNLGDADVSIPGARSHKLVLNYRNSRQILEAAHGVLMDNISVEMIGGSDFDILDPKFANFGGPTPLLLRADSPDREIASALAYAVAEAESNPVAKICVAICGYTEHELEVFARGHDLPVLNGDTRLEAGQVFISDLENTKGFEFHSIIIVNCSVDVIPYPHAPPVEHFRDLSRLYVAMTRARQQLVISYCRDISNFLVSQVARFDQYSWGEYVDSHVKEVLVELPRRLEQLRTDSPCRDFLEMTGEEYLYNEHAIGCPQLLIDKLRAAVSGRNRSVGGNSVEWKNIWGAVKDTASNPRSRQSFGPEGFRLFRERFFPKSRAKSGILSVDSFIE